LTGSDLSAEVEDEDAALADVAGAGDGPSAHIQRLFVSAPRPELRLTLLWARSPSLAFHNTKTALVLDPVLLKVWVIQILVQRLDQARWRVL
jgi:hypothetical protein